MIGHAVQSADGNVLDPYCFLWYRSLDWDLWLEDARTVWRDGLGLITVHGGVALGAFTYIQIGLIRGG